jgi:leucyl aminopeptidase
MIQRSLFFSVLLMIVVFTIESPGQAVDQHDDVLLLIPNNQVDVARTIAGAEMQFYLRLPGAFVAGTSRRAQRWLDNAGVTSSVLDEQPWTSRYAIVTPRPGTMPAELPAMTFVHRLAKLDDMELVKGPEEAFESLRAAGYSCVPVDRIAVRAEAPAQTNRPAGRDRLPTDIPGIIAGVSDTSISGFIQGMQNFGTRYCMNANRDSLFRWLRQRYLEVGISDVALDSFSYNSTWQKNVIATIPGTVNPSAEIIVGGHLDSYSSNLQQAPGADDNASGAVAALEMARVLIQANYQPRLTLRFIGFAAEEVGLRGSADYAQKARSQNRDIRVMMNYDMIGYKIPGQAERPLYLVWYPGSESFSNLHALMATTYTTITPYLTTSYRSSSDSWSFYQQNYNTVFCIERNFSPYYHSPSDLLQYIDPQFAQDVVKSGLAMLLTLDAVPPAVDHLQVLDCGDGTSLMVQWDSVDVPDWYRYKVYIGTQPGVYTSNFVLSTRSMIFNGLTAGVRYYVGASIIDLVGNESPIIEGSEQPLTAPRPPQNVVAHGISHGVSVTWSANAELDLMGYNVFRRTETESTFYQSNSTPFRNPVFVDSPLVGGIYSYYVVSVDSSSNSSTPSDTVTSTPVIVGSVSDDRTLPSAVRLSSNYPNPFNPVTVITYSLPETEHVVLTVYDALGKQVAPLLDELRPAGSHRVEWDARREASGVYYAVLRAGSEMRRVRMVLLR